jgi:HSP20 family protein
MRSAFYLPALNWAFEDFEGPVFGASRHDGHVEETEQGYFIELDAPGIRRDDLKISLEGRHLTVEGERNARVKAKLRRVFLLPDDVDSGAIEAQLRDGVLELALPKIERAKPKVIAVQDAKEGFFQRLLGEGKKSA